MAQNYSEIDSRGKLGNTESERPLQHYDDFNDPRRPLMEHATNRLTDEKATHQAEAELGYGSITDESMQRTAASRRVRRMILIVGLLVVLTFSLWKWFLLRQLQEEWENKEGFMVQENGTYSVAKSSHFDGVRLQTLDPDLVPGGINDPEGKRRLVFIGDIHGCAHELKKLLKRIDFDKHTDHIIAVGDTISKGPENVEVLDKLIKFGASSVRGNHEDRILALAPSILESSAPSDVEEASKSGAEKDAKLFDSLKKHHIKYLQSLPLMLRVPALPMADKPSYKDKSPLAEEIIVVHAGLVPAVSLEKQDPFFVMNMRSITTKKHLPQIDAASKKSKSKPWAHIWGWYNDRLFRKKSIKDFRIWDDLEWDNGADSWLGTLGLAKTKKWPRPQVVVYGHHAKAGLKIDRWSKGLDTGCVRGGKLTAMVLDARGRQEIVSVGCKDHR